jgi:phosphoglycolate phosphatase
MQYLVAPVGEGYFSKVLKLLVFDLDGTLVDTGRDLANSVNHALMATGWPALPVEAVIANIGNGARNLMGLCLDASAAASANTPQGKSSPHGGSGALDAALAVFLDHYRDHCVEESRLYPGLRPALDRLGGYRMAVLTNKPEEPARRILAGLGLAGRFQALVGGDGPLGKKPEPAGLRHIMAALEAEPAETAVIGDGVQDLRVAREAGTRFIAFLGGLGSRQALLEEDPEYSIEDMGVLPEAVARLEKRAP